MVELRAASASDLAPLSELALRSKGFWGYDDAFLAACRAELTLARGRLDTDQIVLAEVDGTPVGYFALVMRPPGAELTDLFVEPAAIGSGVGRRLWDELLSRAVAAGAAWLDIEADPFAAAWYLRRGARQIGTVPSGSIPGRELPRLRVELAARDAE